MCRRVLRSVRRLSTSDDKIDNVGDLLNISCCDFKREKETKNSLSDQKKEPELKYSFEKFLDD